MIQRTYKSTVLTPADSLYAWHTYAGAFRRLTPPWMKIRLDEFEGITDDAEAAFRVGFGPLYVRWKARHLNTQDDRSFVDVQEKGPFASWRHTHSFEPINQYASRLVDDLEYELPAGSLGDQLGSTWIKHLIDQQFAYRHRVTREDHKVLNRYEVEQPLTIAISGSSGLSGSVLTAFLEAAGHYVRPIVRSKPVDENEIYWNYHEGAIEAEKFEDVDAVVHLGSENVFALRWTAQKKKRIYESRIKGTKLLVDALTGLDNPPDTLIAASAMHYYPSHSSEVMTEDHHPADSGFLAKVVHEWEDATLKAREAGIRTVPMRFGIMLSPAGGALQVMRLPFLMGLGGTAGDPSAWMSWVAIDDVAYAIYHAICTDELDGPANCAAPNPETMEHFTGTLARVLKRPAPLHIPAGVLKTIAGEVAEEFALASFRVKSRELESTGFEFSYPELEPAMRHVLGRSTEIPVADD